MAFATANVRRATLGGPLNVTYGDWTGSVGDANGSISVMGGRVYTAIFSIQGTGSPTDDEAAVSVSTTGAVSTITVTYHDTVSAGRFIIVHA